MDILCEINKLENILIIFVYKITNGTRFEHDPADVTIRAICLWEGAESL